MNQYVTGIVIKQLREKKKLTQHELADKLNVTDKAVSKWETGKSYPDITLLESLAKSLDVSVSELLSGSTVTNSNVSANILRSKFYICPVCGNIIFSAGEAVITCHGVELKPCEAEKTDNKHIINVENSDNEYYVTINHPMSKSHYISFVAGVSSGTVQIVKLYPEGDCAARIRRNGVRKIYACCNRDGLFEIKI